MSDKVFDNCLTELNSIIQDLNLIADDIEPNAKGLDAGKCTQSIKWVAKCLNNIKNALDSAYVEDLANVDKKN